jgi:hypothetical protein
MDNETDWECITYAGDENVYGILLGKLETKKQVRGLGRRWKNNIQMRFKEIGYETVNCARTSQVSDQGADLMNKSKC